MYWFIFLILSIIILLYFLSKKLGINYLVTILCSLIILDIIIAPKNCIDAAIKGAELFFYKVFPSVLPFVVIANLIIFFDGINIYSKLLGNILCYPIKLPKQCTFVMIVSALCGYPLGAKYACDLYEKNFFDKNTFERLMNIASNAGPLFIIGSVGTSMLSNTYLGYILLAANYLSCLIMGLILPRKTYTNKILYYDEKTKGDNNIGLAFKKSIENSINTCLSIAGFIILFSVINYIIVSNPLFKVLINILSNIFRIDQNIVKGFILGFIEMTNGCNYVAMINTPVINKIALIGFFLGFSGFSVISQVYSFSAKLKISIKRYIRRKFIQGIICSIISVTLYILFSIVHNSIATFNNVSTIISDPVLLIILFILFIIPLIYIQIKTLFKVS